SERREDREWIAALLGDPETRILALRDLKPFTRDKAAPALDWQPVAQWRDQIEAGASLIFLGLGEGRAHFAIDATGAKVAPDVDTELIDVRALAPAIAAGEAAILAEARSLLDWHARHRFCAQCGTPTNVASAGWVRRCPACRAWPFRSSHMIGFLAEALTEEITVDPKEIAEARWFRRDEIREMVARAAAGSDDPAKVSLPAPIAIAHHICRRWSGGLDSL